MPYGVDHSRVLILSGFINWWVLLFSLIRRALLYGTTRGTLLAI